MSDLFCCAACQKPRAKISSGLRRVLGVQSRVCLGCKDRIDKKRTVLKKRGKLVGVDGKLVAQPGEKQRKFTVGGPVVPTTGQNYLGFDSRYCVDQKTFKGGEFTKLRIGEYIDV